MTYLQYKKKGKLNMKLLSVDNGQIFDNSPEYIMDCIKKVGYNTIIERMDDDIREEVHNRMKPLWETETIEFGLVTFIMAYLWKAKSNLIIG
jgi:tRNA(Ile)-lysidine synthase TilS/MesJ